MMISKTAKSTKEQPRPAILAPTTTTKAQPKGSGSPTVTELQRDNDPTDEGLDYDEVMQKRKGNMLSNAQPGKFVQAWNKATFNPLGSALVFGTGLGLGGYYGGPAVLRGVYNRIRPSLPANVQADIDKDMAENMPNIRKKLAIALAGLGTAGSIWTNVDLKEPVKSLTNWNYGKGVQKKASMQSFNATMFMDTVPLDHASELVQRDKYLSSTQKAQLQQIFGHTVQDDRGNTSMADLTAGAIRAGLGGVSGAVAGYALGSIFSLPKAVTRAMSVSGALAGAIVNAGAVPTR